MRKFGFKPWSGIGKLREETGALDWRLDELAAHYDFAALGVFRVVVNCCNGASSPIPQRANQQLGASFIPINEKIESVAFAHTPSTTADTVGLQLAPLMRPLGTDAGFPFDADSDRVAMATGNGEPVSEEMALPRAADYLLPRGPGKLVITSLSTTALVEEVAAGHGGRALRVPVGRHATIDALLSYRPEQVALAGEGAGAVTMPRFRFAYDGIATMPTILSISAIDDIAAAHGCRVYRSPVGEANVVESMQATGAVIGGEGSSGGIIFPAVHLCRDSFIGIAVLLDRMAETGLPLSAPVTALPRHYRRTAKREFGHGALGPLIQGLEEAFPAAATGRSDGLKLAFTDSRIHVRGSNTEPLLRIAVEARPEDRLEELWGRTMGLLT